MAPQLPSSFRRLDVRTLLSQGLKEFRAGRLDEAERLCRSAVDADRSIPDAPAMLADVLLARQKHADALTQIRRALKLAPKRVAFHAVHGNIQFASGHFGRARDAYRRAVDLEPDAPGHRFNLGLALDRAGELDAAIDEYRRGIELAPSDPRLRINLGEALLRSARLDEAVAQLEEATRLAPSHSAPWLNLARAYREAGDSDRAIGCYDRATGIAPTDPRILTSFGQVLREAGRIDDAVATLRRAIASSPDMPEARITLAMTRRHTERDAEVAWIEALARSPEEHGARPHDAWFAHAKVLEDLGEHDASFDELIRANRARRQHIDYSIPAEAARFARIREVFDAPRVAALRGRGAPDATPILVVGMPRSGTSLVEQILASHPDVFGAGEVTHAVTVFEELPGGYPDAFAAIEDATLRAAGERYVELLRRAAPGAKRIVDKLPMNFVRVGGLRAILPNATIVHCQRDPRDTCLSVFRQNFEQDLGYAFDLGEIGRFHRLHDELMAHWRAVLGPDDLVDVVYEDLVGDLEAGVRRLLDRCGLEFDPACLEFHRTRRAVKTASLQQVRQPAYRSSVGAWRRHESRLGPLFEALG